MSPGRQIASSQPHSWGQARRRSRCRQDHPAAAGWAGAASTEAGELTERLGRSDPARRTRAVNGPSPFMTGAGRELVGPAFDRASSQSLCSDPRGRLADAHHLFVPCDVGHGEHHE